MASSGSRSAETPPAGVRRCWEARDPLYAVYHDEEWGRPVRDEQGLYERLCLEGFQSGLSWLTILRKREGFRAAFAGFDPDAVARFGARDVDRLLGDASIVRHRGKIEAAIANARGVLALRRAGTPLDRLVWSYAAFDRPAPLSYDGWHVVDAGVGRGLEAAQVGRVRVRRPDDGLLDDAGVRRRQRPPRRLLGQRRRRGREAARRQPVSSIVGFCAEPEIVNVTAPIFILPPPMWRDAHDRALFGFEPLYGTVATYATNDAAIGFGFAARIVAVPRMFVSRVAFSPESVTV